MAATNGRTFLSQEERRELPGEFRMIEDGADLPPLLADVRVSELLNKELCGDYLDWLGKHIGALSRRVTASMLAKRYGYLLVAPVLHAMTGFNKGLMLTPMQCRLISPDYSGCAAGKSSFPELAVEGLTVTVPLAGEREKWREDVLCGLFADHAAPLFKTLSECARVPMAILWENAAVRIAPPYEEEEFEGPHAEEDYVYMSSPSSASLFGEKRNPLAKFMGGAARASGIYSARPRLTCCLYYEMAPEYCRKCPKVKSASGN
ncbi:ferric iron reductase [Paenibacillus sp. MY03]|uniref:ferric iron reductase n=1 Tax=Paenibacillus sp. MY03 TaxID=302980 RepID=UPI000B3CEAF9|nr:ferric iron reductase [Paenibacillus sp. MY03]